MDADVQKEDLEEGQDPLTTGEPTDEDAAVTGDAADEGAEEDDEKEDDEEEIVE